MASRQGPRPELIFLSGPQAGQRAVLMTDRAVMGRQATCEVHLQETFASREHARFALTPDGVTLLERSRKDGVLFGDLPPRGVRAFVIEPAR